MRVAHFVESFSPLSETFIYDVVTELERQRLDNHVLTLNRVNAGERHFEKTNVVKAPAWAHPRRLWHRALAEFGIGEFGRDEKDWTSWPVLRSRIKRKLQQLAPDVIHAQFGPAGVIVAPVARMLDVPLVVTFHGFDINKLPRDQRWRRTYQTLFDEARLLIGVSSRNCATLEAIGAPSKKVCKLYNGTRINHFRLSERSASADSASIHCLHVGRLVKAKGPKFLLDAFRCAREHHSSSKNLRLTMAGDGTMRSDVERRINELGLNGSVTLLGAVPHERVATLMYQADLYTQHSVVTASGEREGLGVSLIEASATGLPVVSTRVGGIPEVVAHAETGLLVEERDTEAMGRCIAALATDPERRRAMGRAGRERVEEHFDLEKQVRKLIGIDEDVVSEVRPRK